jgi:hypothetical protein
MDLNKYIQTGPCPNRNDFSLTHFYRNGVVLASINSSDYPALENFKKKNPYAITEKVADDIAFRAAQKSHSGKDKELREQFIIDMMSEFALQDNVFTRALYSMAESLSDNRLSETYDKFSEMSELDAIAKVAYGDRFRTQ